MTLIEMVRKAREKGHRWVAVDKDGKPWSYVQKPQLGASVFDIDDDDDYEKLGSHYNLTCNWKDSLIDIAKLRGIK